MKGLKYLLVMAISITVGLGGFSTTASASRDSLQRYIITDMTSEEFGFWEIDDFVSADIINGFIDSDTGNMSFLPNKNITRAEFTKIIINVLGIPTQSGPQKFDDVTPGRWYYDYINTASSLGIINGYSAEEFKPGSFITRGQMAAMIVRAFKDTVPFPGYTGQMFPDVPNHASFSEEINKAASLGIIQGYSDNTFKSGNLANRVQAVVIMYRAISNEYESPIQDNIVEAHVKDFLTEEANANLNLEQSLELYDRYTTGFYAAYAKDIVKYNNELIDKGYEITTSANLDNIQLSTDFITDRFAEVTVTGTSNYAKFINPDGHVEEKNSTINNGFYLLKKDHTGIWKIYNQYPE
ncbi:S-layer homology domain-containing protein [Rossellomorea sp. YZS02]|uniref:S-layer homology domain-containing protein n=1 Tax=Rossellomorea sp. YZS02 TaxID=3097358 RepID=UPI002A113B74|nr:S-layer homology domain-containing protein [Rossellomorea sp. YZS02]MDX8346132.1 S-layer homology domain-containing protein [Rossellomorea sp. YZS02]